MSGDGSELFSGGGGGDGTVRHYRWGAGGGADQEWQGGAPKVGRCRLNR